ncbi:MAG TPA: helix-turn-helix domain-containing protein, partial [Desulfopila sp.]|nr:helix-turn-helix domain-containing protein [Desulfopila sp.]
TITVPPLSERKEDIPILAHHFLAKHTPEKSTIPRISPEVLQRLQEYEYPGNIRELENIAQRMLLNCTGDTVRFRDLSDDLQPDAVSFSRKGGDSWPTLEEHEKNYILEVLDEVEGNKSKAAKILQIDRVSLWRKIKRYGLDEAE